MAIKKSVAFMTFLREHGGKMSVGTCFNEETGDSWKSLSFHDGIRDPETNKLVNGSTLVNFSSKLGELTPQELKALKNDLQVCELEVPEEIQEKRRRAGKQVESYKLCRNGVNWQDVDFDDED